ncbi:protein RADIALIS-like 3 [Ananas comosus]|nr:protein RADIALIS-like 3 [Ananas comosus]
MASGSKWTYSQNKRFEDVLAEYAEDTPDRWHNVARAVGGGMTAEEAKWRYELLVKDVELIESGRVPFPKYGTPPGEAAAAKAAARTGRRG